MATIALSAPACGCKTSNAIDTVHGACLLQHNHADLPKIGLLSLTVQLMYLKSALFGLGGPTARSTSPIGEVLRLDNAI